MRLTLQIITTLLLLVGQNNLSFSQIDSTKNEIFSSIDHLITKGIQEKAFPGAVLLVSNKDSILIHKAYGYHTYDSILSVDTSHLYDIASITKVVAATLAIMKLYDEGLIKLDDPMKDYVSGFNWNKRGKSTIRELLTHQAGWRSWIPFYLNMIKKDGSYKKRFLRTVKSEKYAIQVGDSLYLKSTIKKYLKRKIKHADFNKEKGYEYSGLFFYLIPEMIESLTGKTYEMFLRENFYDPLGAKSLGFKPLEKGYQKSMIVPTEIDTFFRKQPIHGNVHDEGAILMDGVSGNAGLFSNASDLEKVFKTLLNSGRVDSVELLSPQAIDLFTATQYKDNRRGLGFDKPLLQYDSIRSSVARSASFESYGHTGYTGSIAWVDPRNELIFIFLCNRVYPSRNQRMLYELNLRPRLHEMVYQLVESN